MSSPKHTHIGVLGAGSFGTTMAHQLALAGNQVLLYARNQNEVAELNSQHENKRYLPGFGLSEKMRATSDLSEVTTLASLIFIIIPAKSFRSVARELSPLVSAEHVLIHGTKGLEGKTFKTMSVVLREETCVRRLGVIAGPNLAKEIMEGKPTATVIGSKFDEVIALVSKALRSPQFLVYGNHDILGVELGGTLKNILAIGAGIVDGGGFGANAKSLLLTRGLSELTRLGVHMGAQAETFGGLSGIGDVMATCNSPLSRNYQVGFRLAQGEKLDDILAHLGQVAEGVATTAIVHEYAKNNRLTLNIASALHALLFENVSLAEAQKRVMRQHSSYEIDSETA